MIFEKLREIICDDFELEEEYVTSEAYFNQDLGLDSLDLVDLSMTVEDVFEIEMPFDEEDLEKIKTVGDLVDFIENNIK